MSSSDTNSDSETILNPIDVQVGQTILAMNTEFCDIDSVLPDELFLIIRAPNARIFTLHANSILEVDLHEEVDQIMCEGLVHYNRSTLIILKPSTEIASPEIILVPSQDMIDVTDRDVLLYEMLGLIPYNVMHGIQLEPAVNHRPDMKSHPMFDIENVVGDIYDVNIDIDATIPVQIYVEDNKGFIKVRFLNEYSAWFANRANSEDEFRYLIAALSYHCKRNLGEGSRAEA